MQSWAQGRLPSSAAPSPADAAADGAGSGVPFPRVKADPRVPAKNR